MATAERANGAGPRKEGGRSGGCFRGLASCCHDLCVVSEEESPGARLDRMHREREEQLAAAKKKAAELAEAEEQRAKEWQQELQELQRRREGMTQEELEQDCLSYFATFDHIHESDSPASRVDTPPAKEVVPLEAMVSSQNDADAQQALEQERAEAALLTGPFEDLLQQLFAAKPCSFGELSTAACEGCARSLGAALTSSADKAAADLHEKSEDGRQLSGTNLNALDALVSKYAMDSSRSIQETGPDPVQEKLSQALEEKLRFRAERHRGVSKRLAALLPVLEEDTVSSRLACALAVLDVGDEGGADASLKDFRAPTRALSTADVCWALCSEKRHLIVDCLLPSITANGVWSWTELRRVGLGWWLRGPGTEEPLTAIVTKLAQSAVTQLRRHTDAQRWDMGAPDKEARRLVDEAVFWFSLQKTNVQRLQALLKTGVLRGDPALKSLLEHPRCGQEVFMRKNAFALLQKHRYKLAAALFILCEHYDDAARVIAGHMRDLQLTVLLARLKPDVAAPLLRDRLQESALVRRDRWLRFLLAWHAGDLEVARSDSTGDLENRESVAEDGAVPPLFDGALRLSECSDGLAEVAQRLLSLPRA